MKDNDKYLKFDWIKQKYAGIYEIYPQKCTNSYAFDAVIADMVKHGYKVVQVLDGWIRAFEQ